MARQLDQRAKDLHFDAEVFATEARRARDDGDLVQCEILGEKAVARFCRYWDHLAGIKALRA